MPSRILALAAVGAALLAASPAFADSSRWDRHHGKERGWHDRHTHRHHHGPQRTVIVRPARHYYSYYYYAPRHPVVVYSPPVYVAPRPFLAYREPGLSISIGF